MSEKPRPAYPRLAAGVVVVLFVIVPFLLAGAGGWPGGRDFVSEFGSALGIATIGLLGLLLVLPSRLRMFERLGADVAVRLHRRLASGFLAVLCAHIVVVVEAEPARIGLFRFVGQPWRAQAAICSTVALILLVASSVARRRIKVSYIVWRAAHVTLAVAAMTLAAVHTIGWGRYLVTGVGVLGLIGVSGASLLAIAWLRIGRPRRQAMSSYIVERVVPERGDSATVELRADGHAGTRFRPGQFAWLKLADRRLSLDEHPFSYSSSATRPDRPSFTIRAYSGFSAAAQQLQTGTRLLVDGPHGGFRQSRRGAGMALVANGIGITPMMSILRTAADVGDRRRFVLVYGSRDAEGITFREELDALKTRIRLDVFHVLSRAEPSWQGLTGRITPEVLAAALPRHLRGWQFFLCGAGPAVDSSLRALEKLRVPPERVHAERFVEV